jgi:AAA domain/Bifunctional DNA primase/polymerase, N-terminal
MKNKSDDFTDEAGAANTQASTALRLRLVAGGYTPIPLYGKTPPAFGKNNAKKGLADWQNLQDVTRQQIEMWGKTWPDATNTGALTKNMPTLDLDLLNEEAVRAVEDHVRGHYEEYGYILPRIGKPPKCAIPFRTDEPFTKIIANVIAPNGSAEKIEFLADGQQVAVAGIHPDTQRPYSWHGGEPGQIKREELPYIREEEARQLVDEIVDLLVREFDYRRATERPQKQHKSNGGNDKGFTITTGNGAADWKYLFDNIHEGRELHDSVRDLAGKLIASGMKAGSAVNVLRAEMNRSTAPHDDRWQERYDDIPRAVDTAVEKGYSTEPQTEEHPPNQGLGEWDAGEIDDSAIPPRGWLLGNMFCRGFVSSVIGDGAVGKTATRHAQLMSLATDRELTGEHVFQRCRVLAISLEDDDRELKRRIRAARLYHHVEQDELKGWLFVASPGRSAGKILTIDKNGKLITAGLAERIEKVIQERRIDVVSLDPFIKSHAVSENDNNAIDAVVDILTELASKYDIAVDVPHHVSKGQADPGNANRGRGASAMKDACRLVFTLTPMSLEEAKSFALDETMRRSLIRVDSGKVNIVPPMADAKWFRLVGVPLGNGTDLYPNGDMVQTVEPWTPPDTWAGLSHDLLNRVLTAIDAGMPDGNRYTDAPSAKERAAWHVVLEHAPDKSEAQAREIIKTWVKTGCWCPASTTTKRPERM